MKKLLLIVLIFLVQYSVSAQQLVKGVVMVEGGSPIAQVDVMVKDTDIMTQTNEKGEFSILLPADSQVLIFQKKGFQTQEVRVKSEILYVKIGFEQQGMFDMSLEDILKLKIDVASPKARPMIEMPYITTLIINEDIRNSGARDLMDLLRYVPGLDFGAELDHVVGIGVRGNNATEGKVLVLLDGQILNETNFGSFDFGQHILLDNIDRIEVIRGPGSSIYGGVAELAVINIISKDGNAFNGISASTETSISNGSVLTKAFQIGGGKKLNDDLEFSVSAYGYTGNKSNINVEAYSGGVLDYENDSKFLSYQVNLGLNYKSLNIKYIHDAKQSDNLEKQQGEVYSEGNYFGIKYNYKLDENLTIIPSFTWKNQKPWQFIDLPNYEIYNSTNNRYTANIVGIYDYNDKLNFIFGTEYFLDHAKKESNFALYSSNNQKEISYNTSAIFVEANLFPNFANVTIGARFDFNSKFGSAFVPRFAVTKVINKFHTKLMLSSAFKAPTIQNVDINPDIKPETSNIIELELGYQLAKNMFANVNFFSIDINNAIVYQWFNNADHYVNYEKTGSSGIEMEFKIRESWMTANLAYSFYRANMNNEVPNYTVENKDEIYGAFPNHKVAFTANFNVFNHLVIAPSFILHSERYTYMYDELHNLTEQHFAPTYLANLFLEYNNLFTKGLTISVGVYDITNQQYKFLNAFKAGIEPIYEAGTEFRFKLKYEFKFKQKLM